VVAILEIKNREQAQCSSSCLQIYQSYVTIFVENSQNKLERALFSNFGRSENKALIETTQGVQTLLLIKLCLYHNKFKPTGKV